MALTINNFSLNITGVFVILFALNCYGQNINYRFLDSADVFIDTDTRKAEKYLDSISKPILKSIKGRLADYYSIKALIYDEYNQYSKYHQSNILALKYAVEEENYCVAGQASIDLYTDKYFASDTVGTKYLDQAKVFLRKCTEDEYAILQIEQMISYYKRVDGKYLESNAIILKNLDTYDSIKNTEGYYYAFANYLLVSNYIELKKLEKAHKYFKKFKELKNNNTITAYNYKSFSSALDLYFAEFHFDQKLNDSTFYYLSEASKNSKFMSGDVIKDYYKLTASIYKEYDIEISKKYIDSLVWFQNDMFYDNVDASVYINNNLLETESALINQKNKKASIKKILFWLLAFITIVTIAYLVYYKKYRDKLVKMEDKAINLSFLKSNNEQLAVKVHGLEAYIKNLKKEVKSIALLKSLETQKSRIKELYTSLYINSTTILNKGESHLELINDLNIDFFKKIGQLCPQLNKSEIIICYYILVGFTNKEIAVFLNTSVRSVESKRYRISKKIDFNKNEITLSEYLQLTFGDTLHHTILSN